MNWHQDFIGMSALLHLDSSAGYRVFQLHPVKPYLLQIAQCDIVVLQSRKGSLRTGDV